MRKLNEENSKKIEEYEKGKDDKEEINKLMKK